MIIIKIKKTNEDLTTIDINTKLTYINKYLKITFN